MQFIPFVLRNSECHHDSKLIDILIYCVYINQWKINRLTENIEQIQIGI